MVFNDFQRCICCEYNIEKYLLNNFNSLKMSFTFPNNTTVLGSAPDEHNIYFNNKYLVDSYIFI